jgi:hypothetical protein
MDFRIGGQFFANVKVPVLWGSRAILQDQLGHLSIVNLEADRVVLEVIDDHPGPGAQFAPLTEGYVILDVAGTKLYAINPKTRSLIPLVLRLPPVTVGVRKLRLGVNVFAGSMVVGIGVGIVVTESGITLGGPLPQALANLRVQAKITRRPPSP